MDRMKIGVAAVAAKGGKREGEETAGYDAVDLLGGENGKTNEKTKANESGHDHNSFSIDDEEDDDDEVSSGDSNVSEDDDSDDDDDDSDLLSDGTDDSVVDANEHTNDYVKTKKPKHESSASSSAFATPRSSGNGRRSYRNPLRRPTPSSASVSSKSSLHLSVTRAVMPANAKTPPTTNTTLPSSSPSSHSNKQKRSAPAVPVAVPPTSSFRANLKTARFPSLKLHPNNHNSDQRQRGRHQRLPQNDTELGTYQDEEEIHPQKQQQQQQQQRKMDNKRTRTNTTHKNGNRNVPFKVHDPAQFPLEQFTDAEYGIRNQRPPDTYTFSSSDPNSIDYEPRALQKMISPADADQDSNKRWERNVIFWGFVTAMVIMMIIMIVTVLSYHSHINVKPPPHDLEDICSMSNIATKKGHDQCEDACQEALCCMAMGSASCFHHQRDVCSMYAPCGTIHSNYGHKNGDYNVIVPPPPKNIEALCSDLSLMTESGFLECKGACYPGLCCFPSLFHSSMFSDHHAWSTTTTSSSSSSSTSSSNKLELTSCASTHMHVCANYVPCAALEGLDGVHGSAIELVNSKCTPHNIKYAEGRDECENICQTRSCCFAESKRRNCRSDNEVWCDNFHACNYLLGQDDSSPSTSVIPGPSPSSNGNESLRDKCRDPRKLSNEDIRKCEILCDPAVKCCFFLDDVSCHEQNVDCNFYDFCEGIANQELFPTLDRDDDGTDTDTGMVVHELDLKEEDIIVETGGNYGGGVATSPSDVASACANRFSNECFASCSRYRCCFHPGYDPTSCHASNWCDKVQVCREHFVTNDDDHDGNDTTGGNTDTKDEKAFDDDFINNLYYPDSNSIGDPSPEEIIAACQDDEVTGSPTDSHRCFLYCSEYRCCFEDDFDQISCHSTEFCDQIEVCDKIFVKTTDDDEYNFGGEDEDEDDDDLFAEIADPSTSSSVPQRLPKDVCSVDNLMMKGGYDECWSACADKWCCVLDDGCEETTKDDCSNYESCSILLADFVETDVDGNVLFNANLACKEGDNIKTFSKQQQRTCQDICQTHQCCQNDDTCDSTVDCTKFTACATMDLDMEYYPEPHVNLNTVCTANLLHAGFGVDINDEDKDNPDDKSSSSFYAETCLELCEPAECCRDDTCRHIEDFCVKYVACNNVWEWDASINRDVAVQSLIQSCQDDEVSNDKERRAKCKASCEPFDCCWVGGEENCFAKRTAECRTATEYCSQFML